MGQGRNELGAWSLLLAGGCYAGARALAWALIESGPAVAALVDVAQVLLLSLLLVGVAHAIQGISGGLRRRSLMLVGALAWILAAFTLGDDLGGFSRRQQLLPPEIAFWGMLTFLATSVPLACLMGGYLRGSLGRRVSLAGTIAVAILNGQILKNDYWGIHLLLLVSALVGMGAAWWTRPSLLTRKATLRGVSVLLLCLWPSLLFAPPATAGAALAQASGAPLYHFLAPWVRLKPMHANASDENGGQGSTAIEQEWLVDRKTLPPIAPRRPLFLGEKPLVVMITVDALRADVVFSGKNDKSLPTLAALRNEGIVFDFAHAPGTLTKASLASVFLGIHFSQQYWSPMKRFGGALTVHADEHERFVELLVSHEVSTANFRSVGWLRNGVVMKGFQKEVHARFPKKQGYYPPSPPVFKKLLPYVKKVGKGEGAAFVYSHLADAHAPYDQGELKKGPAYQRYLSELALVDSQLALLKTLLERLSSSRKVLLILSADHGEAFGEHGSQTHGTTMYEEALHVPLIFWTPGAPPQGINDVVSLIDLGPTVLEIFGVPTPGHFMGQSLVPYLRGERPHLTRPVIAETRLMQTLITQDRLKLIVDQRSGRKELYDLKRDPHELKNLADDDQLIEPVDAAMNEFFKVHTLTRDGYTPPFVK